ncbi:hypothetical protein LCGC14_1076770 [marine sediment metagenome]|uniref:Uncharacterized protein n=1 Tax=marine sediment metagenome TaxID=412755 RepID=A0A0F9MGI8_9ZZZZ
MKEVKVKKDLRDIVNLILENKKNICDLIEFQNLAKSFSYEQCENIRKFSLLSYFDYIKKEAEAILKSPQKLINTLKNVAYIQGKEIADFTDLNILLRNLLR